MFLESGKGYGAGAPDGEGVIDFSRPRLDWTFCQRTGSVFVSIGNEGSA
jgi:hypothetical protein